jgi:hypothetical protein
VNSHLHLRLTGCDDSLVVLSKGDLAFLTHNPAGRVGFSCLSAQPLEPRFDDSRLPYAGLTTPARSPGAVTCLLTIPKEFDLGHDGQVGMR